jgi:hypothetical protein
LAALFAVLLLLLALDGLDGVFVSALVRETSKQGFVDEIVGGGCPADIWLLSDLPDQEEGKGAIPHGELTARFGVTLRCGVSCLEACREAENSIGGEALKDCSGDC